MCNTVWYIDDLTIRETTLETGPDIAGGTTPEGADRRPAACPRDQSSLLRVSSAKAPRVIVDSCPACRGLWLDGGELEKLLP